MLIAYQNLRRRGEMDPGRYDGFRAPAGVVFSWIAQVIQVATLVLMVYVPTVGWNPDVLTNVGGAVFMLVTGEIAIWWAAGHSANKGDLPESSRALDEA